MTPQSLFAGLVTLIGICLFFFIVWKIESSGYSSTDSNAQPSYSTPLTPPPIATHESREDMALPRVELVNFHWHKDGFDSVMISDFTIRNNNDFNVKDITITCDHSGNSGTEIDSNTRTIYDVVKANRKRTFPKVNMGFIHSQVARSQCHIVSVVPD